MIMIPCQNGYRSEVLLIFDSTIADIEAVLQAGKLGRDQAAVEV